MSRFENLEFNGEFEQRPESALADESSCLRAAQAAFHHGDFEQALRGFAKALEYNPHNAASWTGQVRMLIELDELDEARRWADKALERFPHDPELLAAKAVALGRAGDVEAALAFSDAAIDERGDTPYVWLARGDVMLARDEKRADYCFDKAVLLAPHDWVVHWLASRIRYYYRKFALALKHAQQAVALDAAQAVVWLQIGRCQEVLGIPELARASYEQARQLDPSSRVVDHALMNLQPPGFLASIRTGWKRLFFK